tara:strand:- start:54 stop:281 length:228 start_codon:yes stop_codon:yes gene_type:complete
MNITEARLKQIIKEELSNLNEEYDRYSVENLGKLLSDAEEGAEVLIKHYRTGDLYEVYEAYTTDEGAVVITVRER